LHAAAKINKPAIKRITDLIPNPSNEYWVVTALVRYRRLFT